MLRKDVSGEIEPITFGVFIYIAKDIRQLQGLALGECKTVTRVRVKPEHPCRQPANRRCHPITIEYQFIQVLDPHTIAGVHLHAGNDGLEVFLTQLKSLDSRQQRMSDDGLGVAGKQTADLVPPLVEFLAFLSLGAGTADIIGNVVDFPAKCIDRIHGRTLCWWQTPHRPIE